MIFAVLGAIDGNAHALRSALAAIEEAGVLTILHTGNSVAGDAQGAEEVMRLLVQHRVVCAEGPLDRAVVKFARRGEQLANRLGEAAYARVARAAQALRPDQVELLQRRKRLVQLELEGAGISLSHGSPASERELLEEDTPLVRFQRAREVCGSDIVVCGGGSGAFSRYVDGALIVNAGAVPQGDRAQYVLINTESQPMTASILSAPLA